jgi:hypothetical protein
LARLKPCPCYKARTIEFFRSLQSPRRFGWRLAAGGATEVVPRRFLALIEFF